MKGSKKYASFEYSFTKGAAEGLGKELDAQKSSAHKSRESSRTYPQKMDEGGTIQSGISQAAAQGGVPHTQVNTMGSVASGLANAFGKADGGKVGKHDAKNLKQLDSSMRKFFKEEAQEKTKGGKIEAKKEDQKAEVRGNSKKNDKVPVLLSEGEVVLPRTVAKAKNAPQKAAKFMKKEMKKNR